MTGAPGVGDVLGGWELDPGLFVALAGAALAYVVAARRARRWPRPRSAAFLAGLAVLAFALASGVDRYAGELLSVHMVQHLLLTMLAAPLLAVGAPVTLALRASGTAPRHALGRTLRRPVVRALARPPVALALFAAVLVGTHATPLYRLAIEHPGIHAFEHALYLGSALLFWASVLGAEPLPHPLSATGRVLVLLLLMPAMSAVGVWLMTSDAVAYAPYLAPARRFGISAVADQHLAGAIMWIGGTMLLVVALLATGWDALRREERRELARERYADAAGALR